MPRQFSELFHAQAPLRELGPVTLMAFGKGQRIIGKNRGGKNRKAEKCQWEYYFAFQNTQFGEGLCSVRHACFWRGKNGEIIWRR